MFRKLLSYVKSLRFFVFILILIIGIVPTFGMRLGVLYVAASNGMDERFSDMNAQVQILSGQILTRDYLKDASAEDLDAQIDQLGSIFDARVLVIDDSFEIVKDTFDEDTNRTILSESVIKAYQGETVQEKDLRNNYIELTVPLYAQTTTDSDEETVVGVVQVCASTDFLAQRLQSMRQWLTVIQVGIAALAFLISFIFSGRIAHSLHKLAESIRDVKEGYSDIELPKSRFTETDEIADAYSDMMARLQRVNDSRKEFVANVSHELRTPLASMKVLADALNTQEDVPIEMYREFMGDITAEIEREDKIINDLLALVKMDKKSVEMNISEVNINHMLELLMKRLKPIAQKNDVELLLETYRPISADIDEVKLTLAFSNLIENAIKYNNPGGYVRVQLNADHKDFFLRVEDNGIGIPEEDQEHIFERFYRVDKSHSREIGGTGLGLAITRDSILMHHGAIKLYSIPGTGSTFTVRIPLKYTGK